MNDGDLTGNRRLRYTPNGLVLELEYNRFVKTLGTWRCFWRQARAEDVQETVIGLPGQRG